jgi:hypothetical protein
MFNLELSGAGETAARIETVPAAVAAVLATKAAALAEDLRRHVADDKLSGQVLQVRSGTLKASIASEVVVDGDRVLARVYSSGDVKYAMIQEYGGRTGPHDILPVKARALAFLAGGRQVFAKIVHHPGSDIPERSYLRSGLDDLAALIAGELKSAALVAAQDRLSGAGA